MSNPFGLIYGGAIEANEPGKVNIRPVRYTVDGIGHRGCGESLPARGLQ